MLQDHPGPYSGNDGTSPGASFSMGVVFRFCKCIGSKSSLARILDHESQFLLYHRHAGFAKANAVCIDGNESHNVQPALGLWYCKPSNTTAVAQPDTTKATL